MFPLRSKPNGVLERNGHTEATVDLMRIAGLKECGLCCEIMKADGTMMRKEDLIEMSEKFNLKFIQLRQFRNTERDMTTWLSAWQLQECRQSMGNSWHTVMLIS